MSRIGIYMSRIHILGDCGHPSRIVYKPHYCLDLYTIISLSPDATGSNVVSLDVKQAAGCRLVSSCR